MNHRPRITVLLAASAMVAASCSASSARDTTTSGATEAPAPTTVASSSAPRPASTTTVASSSAPEPASTTTAAPQTTTTTVSPYVATSRLEIRDVWVFPGPEVYAGDRLTFQVPVGGFGRYALVDATLTVDGAGVDAEPVLSGDPLLGAFVIFADAYDTTNRVGGHLVDVTVRLDPERTVQVSQRFVVRPDEGRPAQERSAEWVTATTSCCDVRYLTDTAAARDIASISALIDEAAAELETLFGLTMPRVRFVLIDTLWGNGGYAAGEVVMSYIDRDYGPGRANGLGALVTHELAHAISDQLEASTPWPLAEGLAVHVTGGHYKPEPLAARAAALRAEGSLPALEDLFDEFPELQHEQRYVAVGAFVDFVVAEYGWETFLDLYDEDIDAPWGRWLRRAARRVLGLEPDELQAGFDAWLDQADPAAETDELALTVALQDVRRRYQARHAPYPSYLGYESVTTADQVALALREGTTPELVAVEAMISAAQQAIATGRLDEGAALTSAIGSVIDAAAIDGGIASDYLGVARALDGAGFELVDVVFAGDTATAVAIAVAPSLETVTLVRSALGWRLTT